MRDDAFVEVVLQRVREIEQCLLGMNYAEAVDFAHLVSHDAPEVALRMLTAELLLQRWRDTRDRGTAA